MKEQNDTQKSAAKQLPLWKDADEYVAWLHQQRRGALKAVAEMLKHPVSLEEARAQYDRLHGKNYWSAKKENQKRGQGMEIGEIKDLYKQKAQLLQKKQNRDF